MDDVEFHKILESIKPKDEGIKENYHSVYTKNQFDKIIKKIEGVKGYNLDKMAITRFGIHNTYPWLLDEYPEVFKANL